MTTMTKVKRGQQSIPMMDVDSAWLVPKDIEIGWRARTDPGDLTDLVSSIAKRGQIHPIRVSNGGGKPLLIAGFRRIKACERLKIKVRAEVVSAQEAYFELQQQIEENTIREAMDALQQAEALAKLKELYEIAHPETKPGATGGKGKARRTKDDVAKSAKPVPRFTLAIAPSMGCSERRVQDLLQLMALPKRERDQVAKAKTPAERSRMARELLSKARNERKKAELKKRAAERKQTRLEDVGKEAKPPIHVYHENCLELMAKLSEESVDLVLTDPPYDRERSIIAHAARASINPKEHEWDKLDVGWVLRVAPLLVPGGTLLTFCPLEAIGAYELACKTAELDYRMTVVWCKTNPGPAHRPTYVSAVEAIVWATKPGATPFFKPWEGKSTHGDYHPMNWFDGPICGGNERIHPTQKPLWLISKLLDRHSSAELGHTVLDPFAGAGTTGVACRLREQSAILIEWDADYVEMIRNRLGAL